MSYIDTIYLLKIISETELRQVAGDSIRSANSDRVDEAIAEAEDVVHSYLRGRYEVPFVPPTDRIKSITRDITIYNLYKARPNGSIPEGQTAIYNRAIKTLEDIRDGKILLYDPSTDTLEAGPSPILATKASADRRFGESTLKRAYPWETPK